MTDIKPEANGTNLPAPVENPLSPGLFTEAPSLNDILKDVLTPASLPLESPQPVVSGPVLPVPSLPKPTADGVTPAAEPLIPIPSELDNLLADIDKAELEDASPASVNSFKGLKARYKNGIEAIKQENQRLASENAELVRLRSENQTLQSSTKEVEELRQRVDALQAQNKEYEAEVKKNRYYRQKYDFENDPVVKKHYTGPMNDVKSRGMDIILNSAADSSTWDRLVSSTSEYEANRIIEGAGISGLNAQALKEYVSTYRTLHSSFKEASKEEVIEAELARLRGRSKEQIAVEGKEIFDNVSKTFSQHIQQLQESEVNKEHNFLVYDKVLENAVKSFETLKGSISPDILTPAALTVLAQASLVTSAYPFQFQMAQHLLQQNHELQKELKETQSTPGLSHVRESVSTAAPMVDITKILDMNVNQIAEDTLRGRG